MSTLTRYRRSMREAEMQQGIIDLVAARGGRTFHIRDSRGLDVEDLPDLIVLAPWMRTVAFIEVKSQRRVVTPGQLAVLAMLAECPRTEAMLMRPEPRDGERAYDGVIRWLGGQG